MTATKTPSRVKERRREFRRSVVFPLRFVRINELTFQKNKWDHEVGFNIGIGGMAAKSDAPLPAKASVTVRLLLPNEKRGLLDLEAQLIWIKPVREDHRKLYHMGLEFTSLDPHVREEIQRYLDAAW